MDFDEALAYMQSLRRFGIKLGNDRFAALLDRLGNPHLQYGVAHVAGTKGKGSTTAMIAAILQEHGFRVGSYFSPYVYDVRERVQVDAEMIPREDFARLVTAIAPHIEHLKHTEHGQTTEFELKTALGFCYFLEQGVDFAAVEVGIGGRLDATNVVAPLVSVITNIGLDHTHILGDTHAKIAYEKAGIIKPEVPLVTAVDHPEALQVIARVAHEKSSPMRYVTGYATSPIPNAALIRYTNTEPAFTVETPSAVYPELRTRLRGTYQRTNAACAIGAAEECLSARGLKLDPEAVRRGLARAYLPGRMDIVCMDPMVILDGAHNELAARALAAELERLPYRRLILVIGMVAGHDPQPVLQILAPKAYRIIATQPTWSRGLPAEVLAETAIRLGKDAAIIRNPLDAAREALSSADADDLVLVTGSFYVVGDVPPDALLDARSARSHTEAAPGGPNSR
jgi:dihydrofolate synthase/folylpolyglutamate synthase